MARARADRRFHELVFLRPQFPPIKSWEGLSIARDLSYFMQSVFLPALAPQRADVWQLPMDVYQTRDGWLIKADLAGVNPEDLGVELHNRHISIRGQRRDTLIEEGCCCYRMEIS